MAVIFDASGDRLTRTASVIDYNAAYSFSLWVKLTAGGSGDDTLFCLSDNTINNFDAWRVQRSTNFLIVTSALAGVQSSFVATSGALTNGVWHNITGRRVDTNTLQVAIDGTDVITYDHPDIAARTACTSMCVGALTQASGGNPIEGAIACFKLFTGSISYANLANEKFLMKSAGVANMWANWPLLEGDHTKDHSGNERDWTDVGTITHDHHPPLSWGANNPFASGTVHRTIVPSGRNSSLTLGSHTLLPGAVTVLPSSIVDTPTVGDHVLTVGAAYVLPSGIASTAAFGDALLVPGLVTILPDGVDSGLAYGTPVLASVVQPSGIVSTADFGTALLIPGTATILPGGIDSTAVIGDTFVADYFILGVSGISSTVAIGSHTLLPGVVTILPSSIVDTPTIGDHTAIPGTSPISPSGRASTVSFGTLALLPGSVTVLVPALGSGHTIGSPFFGTGAQTVIQVPGIGPVVVFGGHALTGGRAPAVLEVWAWGGVFPHSTFRLWGVFGQEAVDIPEPGDGVVTYVVYDEVHTLVASKRVTRTYIKRSSGSAQYRKGYRG